MKLAPQSTKETIYTGTAVLLPIIGQIVILTRPQLSVGAKIRGSIYSFFGSFFLLMLIPVPDVDSSTTASEVEEPEVESAEVTRKLFKPRESCGSVEANADLIYPVYLDGLDLESARRNFCGDALSTTRKNTGAESVLLASFDSLNKAQTFAEKVNGEVGEPDFFENRAEEKIAPQPAPEPEPVYEEVPAYESESIPTSVMDQWAAPDGYESMTTAEGIKLAVQKQPGGLGCSGYHYGCITYKVVFSEDCSSASATGVFLGNDGGRVRDDYNIDSDVRANETLVWAFGFEEGDENRATKFSLREIECDQY